MSRLKAITMVIVGGLLCLPMVVCTVVINSVEPWIAVPLMMVGLPMFFMGCFGRSSAYSATYDSSDLQMKQDLARIRFVQEFNLRNKK